MNALSLDTEVQELEGLDVPGFWEGALGIVVGIGLGAAAVGVGIAIT
jgi:hypothetical protein